MANNTTPQPNPEEVRELLSPYLDGEVSDAERAMVEQAVAGSPELQEELESLRQTIALLSSLPPMPAPRPFTLTAADVGHEETPPPQKQSWFPFPAWAGGLAALLGALICVLAAGGLLFGAQFGGGAMAPAELALQRDSAAMPTPIEQPQMAAGAAEEAEEAAEAVEAYSADEDAAASEAAPAPEQESLMVAPQEAPAVESMEMPAAEPVEEQAAPQRQAIEEEGRQEKTAAEQEAAMAAAPEAEEVEEPGEMEVEALEEPAAADEAAPPADDETALMTVPESAPAGDSETEPQLRATLRPQPTATPPATELGADTAAEVEVPTATPEVQATSTALAAALAATPPPPPTPTAASTPRATPAPTPPTPAGPSGWGSGVLLTTGLAGLLLAGALIWLALRRRQS